MKAWTKLTKIVRFIKATIDSYNDEKLWDEVQNDIPHDLLKEMEKELLDGAWGVQAEPLDPEERPSLQDEEDVHPGVEVAGLDDRTVVLLDKTNANRLLHLGELLNYPPSEVILMALMVLNLHVNSKQKGDRVVIISREGRDFEFDI